MSAKGGAKKWLESVSARYSGDERDPEGMAQAAWRDSVFNPLFLYGLHVSFVSPWPCSLLHAGTTSPHLTDMDGNWRPGPIPTLIDLVAAATIMSCEGTIKVSVDLDISFFSPAKISEEMVIEIHALQNKGRLTGVVVEIRKKGDNNLVAVGREWMTSPSAQPFESKL